MAELGALVATAAIIASLIFFAKLIANRRHVGKLQAAKVPMPEYHSIFGHFIALKTSLQALPKNTTMHVVVRHLSKTFSNNGVFYLNLWPFQSETLMVVANPFVASQIEAVHEKPAAMCDTIEVINGGPSLMTMHGGSWKKWRGMFSLGFAPGYMTGFAPKIAEEVGVFCKLMREKAKKGEMFQLEEFTLRLTFDIIARVTLDARLHYQTQGSPLADCLRRQVYWTPFKTSFNPIRRYLSPRPLVQKYNSYCMDQYLDKEIDMRFEELAQSRFSPSKELHSPQSRSIISLAMNNYLEEVGDRGELSKTVFKKLARPQLRLFLYAGHDTTSSTLLYTYLLLSRHPEALSKLRAEHDAIFGNDFSAADTTNLITRDPTLLNQLPYTLAVIKETLRIFPPAGSLRSGSPSLILTDEHNNRYPTEGCYIWTLPLIMHNIDSNFPDANSFIPDRWLVGPEHPLYPPKGSWRAFEWGPRSCIGQTLATLELKVVLVMTVRLFDIREAYEDWDKYHIKKGVTTADGERAYQAEMGGGGAHPVDGFPVRVTLKE